MELIITKAFLENYFLEYDAKSEYHIDWERFLKRFKSFVLVTDMEELENFDALSPIELEDFISSTPFLSLFFDNIHNIVFQKELSSQLQTNEFYQKGSIFKLFFTTIESNQCQELSEKFGYIYLNPNNLVYEWKLFYNAKEDTPIPITLDPKANPKFDSWEKIKLFQHPIRSMLIFDKYLLSDKSTGPIDKNLFPLLLNLLQDFPLFEELDLTILCELKFNKESERAEKTKTLNKRIQRFFRKNFVHLNVNVTLIHYDEGIRSRYSEKEHDRGLYTNYFFIKVGAGFNVFDKYNKILNASDMDVLFLFSKTGRNVGFRGLRNFKQYINKLESLVTDNPSKAEYIHPKDAKENKLLNDYSLDI
ncbi:MAG: hypothetical protein R3E32_12125 [Chitinophagales bacterium]